MPRGDRSTPGTRVVIAAASDEAYAMPLAVMLRSAIENLGAADRLEAYIAADDLSEVTRGRVEESLPSAMVLHWIPRSTVEFTGFPRWGRMPLGTYHKVTLGSWLPLSVERAIWLDCDTLVLDDLSQLWNESLGDCTVAACRDRLVPTLGAGFGVAGWRELGLAAEAPYFNAGVLVVDVGRWRATNVEARSVDYLRRFGPRVWFWDQEALNATFAGQWHALEDRWNHPPARDDAPFGDSHRGIVHFSGGLKPWRVAGRGREFLAWERWLDRTAWAGTRPARSVIGRVVDAYTRSRLRAWFLPLERLYMRWIRWYTSDSTRSTDPRR